MEVRPLLDELIVDKAIEFIKREASNRRPFYAYVALSRVHPPEKAHPDFDHTSPERLGLLADLIAEMDYRVGHIVDCIEEVGISENTIIVFSSDNAASLADVDILGQSNGPYRGGFMTPPWEGSMRVPAMVRWPGAVPARVVTEQMLSAHDWYSTFAALAGASDRVPTDRPIDSIDASKFLLGESERTGRENILFFGPDGELMASKWHNVKVVFRYCEGIDQPIVEPQFPMFFDLGSDPGERYNLFDYKLDMGWMFGIALSFIAEYKKSIVVYPEYHAARGVRRIPSRGSRGHEGYRRQLTASHDVRRITAVLHTMPNASPTEFRQPTHPRGTRTTELERNRDAGGTD